MEKQDYTTTITVSQSAEAAFKSIHQVNKWWMEDLQGDSENLNGVFSIHFRPGAFVTHKLIEVIPNKKVVWLVTDCNLDWLKDKKEWNNTQMIFEISSQDDKTQIRFTHIGIVPAVECYESCVKGWDQYIKGSLFKLITEGKGEPAKKKEPAAE